MGGLKLPLRNVISKSGLSLQRHIDDLIAREPLGDRGDLTRKL